MALLRKMRFSGNSIVVTIPSQLTEAYGITNGDIVEVTPLKNGEIKIKKIEGKRFLEGIE